MRPGPSHFGSNCDTNSKARPPPRGRTLTKTPCDTTQSMVQLSAVMWRSVSSSYRRNSGIATRSREQERKSKKERKKRLLESRVVPRTTRSTALRSDVLLAKPLVRELPPRRRRVRPAVLRQEACVGAFVAELPQHAHHELRSGTSARDASTHPRDCTGISHTCGRLRHVRSPPIGGAWPQTASRRSSERVARAGCRSTTAPSRRRSWSRARGRCRRPRRRGAR